MSMSNERAVETGQLSQSAQSRALQTGVGYFEPPILTDLDRQGRLYIIADTVSGAASAQIASQYAVNKVLHSFYTSNISDTNARLLDAVQQANADILEENNRHPDRRPIVVSLAAASIHDNKLLVASVGDNRVYVVWDQDIEQLTQEITSAVATPEKNKLDPSEVKLLPTIAKALPQKKVNVPVLASPRERIPRGLGLDEKVKINLFARRLFAGDIVMLCSGGLTGYVAEQEIPQALNGHSPEEAIKRLISQAEERGNQGSIAISMTRVLPNAAATQAPKPASLPSAPSWDALRTQLKPATNNNDTSAQKPANHAGHKAATGPMPAITPASPLRSQSDLAKRPAQAIKRNDQTSRRWQYYAAVALLLLVVCGVPLLVWNYMVPDDIFAGLPFIGDDASSNGTNDEAANASQVITEAGETKVSGNSAAASMQRSSVATPTNVPGSADSRVVGNNSPIPTPVGAFVSPVTTPTSGLDQANDTQTAADSIVILTTPTPTPLPTPTLAPLPTVVLPANCENKARFYRDVTVPDGTQFSPGESFDKVWLLTNAATCPWGPGYTLRFIGGDLLGTASSVQLLEIVQPDTNGEITVPMVAPNTPGIYRSEWQLYNLDGETFGPEMYVEIEVVSPSSGPGGSSVSPPVIAETVESEETNLNTDTLYDFIQNMESASWSSGSVIYTPQETSINETLELPAPQGLVASGIAQLRGNRQSENNVLLTYPHQDLGLIEGAYSVDIPLQPDDVLVGSLGFIKLSILSDDGVTFEVAFKPDNNASEQLIFSQNVQYPDSPIQIRQSLTNIQPSQTGTFILRVRSGESLSQDWATWIDMRLVRPK